jgi:hypothetical protein
VYIKVIALSVWCVVFIAPSYVSQEYFVGGKFEYSLMVGYDYKSTNLEITGLDESDVR